MIQQTLTHASCYKTLNPDPIFPEEPDFVLAIAPGLHQQKCIECQSPKTRQPGYYHRRIQVANASVGGGGIVGRKQIL
jgi:hypothetical protein